MTMKKLQHRQSVQPNSIQEPHDMEVVILKALQQEFNPDTSLSSPLAKLDPYTDSNAIIRVGGWLNLSDFPGHFPSQCIDATILPTIGDVTDLIFRHFHHKGKQQGRGNTTNEIRATGYWIVGATCAVSSIIYHCVPCRKLHGTLQEQRMVELSCDRLEPALPFTNCAVNCFAPFIIKEGHKDLKHCRVLFTCMASRAVHVEVAATVQSDPFINAFRRFVSRGGPVWQLRGNQGMSLVVAGRELEQPWTNWFVFKMNGPSANHMGGVWEQQIRWVCNLFATLLQTNGSQHDNKALSTFMCEAEAIVYICPRMTDSWMIQPLWIP